MQFGAPRGFHTIHEESNIKLGGGLDDVWLNNKTRELHIVDYKSTSQKSSGKQITLDDPWKAGYKRQMDIYAWILQRKGFVVSGTAYFLYCDGDRFTKHHFLNDTGAVMHFKVQLIPYEVKTDWIERTLVQIRSCLTLQSTPQHSQTCEFGRFIEHLG